MNLSQLGRGRSLEMIVRALAVIVSQSVIARQSYYKNFRRSDTWWNLRRICIEPSRISGFLLLPIKEEKRKKNRVELGNRFHESLLDQTT